MKNKYFGDINDYRKYGLIRAILRSYKFRLLVAWMLTPDDPNNDGKFTDYLSTDDWRKYDEELYDGLKHLMNTTASVVSDYLKKQIFYQVQNTFPERYRILRMIGEIGSKICCQIQKTLILSFLILITGLK